MAFDPPLGSTSPAVLLDNAKRLDELTNGPAATVPDRAGEPLDSWRKMQEDNAALVDETRKTSSRSAGSIRPWQQPRRISRISPRGAPPITAAQTTARSQSR